MYEINNKMYKEIIRQIRQNWKLIAVPGVWCPSMFRVYGCVFCSISLVSVYMCVRMPLSWRSIAGVPSSRALPGYPITTHHQVFLWKKMCRWQDYETKCAAGQIFWPGPDAYSVLLIWYVFHFSQITAQNLLRLTNSWIN